MTAAAVIVAILFGQTGLLAWIELRNRRVHRSIMAKLDAMIARPDLLDARLAASDPKRNGGDHVAVDHPQLIEFRQ
jgi:hypothetical protein